MKLNYEDVKVARCFEATDGTKFYVSAVNATSPTDDEIARAKAECEKYERSALYIVMEKLGKSKSVLASNFIPFTKDYIDMKFKGSEGEDYGSINYTDIVIKPIYNIINFNEGHGKWMLFCPQKKEDIYNLKQFFLLYNRITLFEHECGCGLEDLEVGKKYYIFICDIDSRLPHTYKITPFETIKKEANKIKDHLDMITDLIENPDKYCAVEDDDDIKVTLDEDYEG